MSEQKSSARFTAFCIILLVIWYVLDTPIDLNLDWNPDDFDIFSDNGFLIGCIAVALIAIVFTMVMARLVIAGVSLLLVGFAILIGGLLLMIFSPFLLPVLLLIVVLGIFKRKSR